MRLTAPDVARIRELRYQDGLSCERVASSIGCSAMAVHYHAPGWPGKVDNAKLRAAFLASGLTASEVARRVGWWNGHTGDGQRVKRTLGLSDDWGGHHPHRTRTRRRLIDAETAGVLAEAIGVMPWEVIDEPTR